MIPVSRQGAGVLQTDCARRLPASLDRNRLFAGLFVIGFANGVVNRVADGFERRAFADLVMNTFDISAIVWVALIVGGAFLLRPPTLSVTHADQVAGAAAAAAFLIPIAPLAWVALSGLAIYALHTSPKGCFAHRGAWILLAMTIPMFWSRAVFSLLSDPILEFDAILVGWIVGTERFGNAIGFSDGSGYLWIAPACSSITNVSLAILCWVLFTQVFYRERSLRRGWWCVAACAAVVAINVARLSLLAIYHQHQEIMHGVAGATVANWVTLAAIVGICTLGVRHDFAARR